MIIQCPECQTRYQVAPERFKAGAKMRCHKCRAIFVPSAVTEPEPVAPIIAPPPVTAMPESPAAPEPPTAVEDDIFGSAFEQAAPAAEAGDEDDLRFDEPAPADATVNDDEDFDFGDLNTASAVTADDGFDDGFVTELEDELPEDDDLLDDAFSAANDALGEMPAANAANTSAEEEDWAVELPPAKQSNPLGLVKTILLLLLLALLGGVAYLMWTDGADAPVRLIQQLLSRAQSTSTVARVDLEQVKAYYVTNAAAGEMYVIEGTVIDREGRRLEGLRVKGTLYGSNGPLRQDTAICGHQLTTADLRQLPLTELNARLAGATTAALSPRAPFTLIFTDLPQGMTEFTVEVVPS